MDNKVADTTEQKDKRKYPMGDVKLLYSRSMGKCGYPACPKICVEEDLSTGEIYNSGQIAHIEGVAKKSARHNPNLSLEDRDAYPNWILMCGDHHPRIDAEGRRVEITYTTEVIRKWKRELETRLVAQTQQVMPNVTSLELDFITKYLLLDPVPSGMDSSFVLLAVKAKIAKNKLSAYVESLLEIGIAKAPEVSDFVNRMEGMNSGFAESLRAGFVAKYAEFHTKGYREDALFEALRDYACQGSADTGRRAAGLAVLSYYFELCEVFEK
jgi:hypothetical protein